MAAQKRKLVYLIARIGNGSDVIKTWLHFPGKRYEVWSSTRSAAPGGIDMVKYRSIVTVASGKGQGWGNRHNSSMAGQTAG